MFQSFLDAILAAPENDEPRLALADWLDQSCDPRGEFIRVQCRLEQRVDSLTCLLELERRERELLHEFEHAWAEPISGLVDGWVFRRGFVEEVMTSAALFVTHAPELFRRMPVREVHISDLGDQLAALASVPELGRIRFLDLSENRIGDRSIGTLTSSPHLGRVQGLNLSCTGLGNAGAAVVARCPHFQSLRELYLSSNRIGDDGARILAQSPFLDQVDPLFLNHNYLSSAGVEVLYTRFSSRLHL